MPTEKKPKVAQGRIVASEGSKKVEFPVADIPFVKTPEEIASSEDVVVPTEEKPDFAVVESVSDEGYRLQLVDLNKEETCKCENCDCRTEEPAECNCVDYEGQDFDCKMHVPVTHCPRCNCIDTGLEIVGALEPMKNYQCRVCGIFFMRNMVTGEHIHN